uniref:Uncharacterized protein n=1 Tax=Lactuca sativa TaxID=4236 RepID=A0A9R1XN07_LACSA|nr:hypothetical protein LSAT_V11C300101580 [Lactuca sativa]
MTWDKTYKVGEGFLFHQRGIIPTLLSKVPTVVAGHGATTKDVTPEMVRRFENLIVRRQDMLLKSGKLRVIYLPPPQRPSLVPEEEEPEEGSSPKATISNNGNSSSGSEIFRYNKQGLFQS